LKGFIENTHCRRLKFFVHTISNAICFWGFLNLKRMNEIKMPADEKEMIKSAWL